MPVPGSAAELNELQELDRIRLAHDWSWSELAEQMSAASFPVAMRTLHYLVKGTKGTHAHDPNDRTLHKIRQYLAHQKDLDARRAARNTTRRRRRQKQQHPNGGR